MGIIGGIRDDIGLELGAGPGDGGKQEAEGYRRDPRYHDEKRLEAVNYYYN